MIHRARTPLLPFVLASALAVIVVPAAPAPAQAQPQPYLAEMPAAARVIADTTGRNAMDTRARQIAALSHLLGVLQLMAGPRYFAGPFPNAAEAPLVNAYKAAAARLRAEGIATFPPGAAALDSPRATWVKRIDALERSQELDDELRQRYFSPAVQATYDAARGVRAGQSAAGRSSINQGLRDLHEPSTATWDRLDEEQKQAALSMGGLMGLLLLAGAVRELRPFRIVPGDPVTLRAGFRKARLHWATGVVSNWRSQDKTNSTLWERTRENGSVERYWTSTTLRTEWFDLESPEGTQHIETRRYVDEFSKTHQFEPWIGKRLTAAWALPRSGKKPVRFVMFRAPGAESDLDYGGASGGVSHYLSPRLWTIFPAMMLGFVIGSSTDLLSSVLRQDMTTFRGFVTAALAIPCWGAVALAIDHVRARRFAAREIPKLRALVDAAPRG